MIMVDKTRETWKTAFYKKTGVKFGDMVSITVMLAIPVVHWLVFWLGVNMVMVTNGSTTKLHCLSNRLG